MASQQLDVYLDIDDAPHHIGQAWFSQRRSGPVSTVFSYNSTYLAQAGSFAIDPQLDLVSGNQYVDKLPGAFQDCSPDRWGRNLIDKQHRASTGRERSGGLNDVDYLVGVSDETRQGALRFTLPGGTTFLDPDSRVPKLIQLPILLNAADQIDSADDLAAVKDLLDAGSGSLGGARPKASVADTNGHLLIAKFPHREDEWDVMAWEFVALTLAKTAGIRVPQHELITVPEGRNILLLHRFDRTTNRARVPYMSAMTALTARDGEWHDYVEIAEIVTDIGGSVTDDLAELYRRAAFNVAINNTDDHLRNHGFLAPRGPWRLAPAFDMNPNPHIAAARLTGISGTNNIDDADRGLDDLAQICRLSPSRASTVREQIAAAVSQWRQVALAQNIAPTEIDRFREVLDR